MENKMRPLILNLITAFTWMQVPSVCVFCCYVDLFFFLFHQTQFSVASYNCIVHALCARLDCQYTHWFVLCRTHIRHSAQRAHCAVLHSIIICMEEIFTIFMLNTNFFFCFLTHSCCGWAFCIRFKPPNLLRVHFPLYKMHFSIHVQFSYYMQIWSIIRCNEEISLLLLLLLLNLNLLFVQLMTLWQSLFAFAGSLASDDRQRVSGFHVLMVITSCDRWVMRTQNIYGKTKLLKPQILGFFSE